jgi:hypothetical protein
MACQFTFFLTSTNKRHIVKLTVLSVLQFIYLFIHLFFMRDLVNIIYKFVTDNN